MTRVYLALGANVGNPQLAISQAIDLLRPSIEDIEMAPLYRTRAVGYTEQPDFINTVIRGHTGLQPAELLTLAQQIEQRVGRTKRFRWGPREIDIDIIFYGDQIINSPELTVPHPRFAERDFVLQPLCDLDSALVDPGSGQSVAELLKTLPETAASIIGQLHTGKR